MHKINNKLACVLVFLIFSGAGAYWVHLGQVLYNNEQRVLISELVNAQASALERRLARSLSAARILAQEVRQNLGVFDDFDSYAESVLRAIGGVSNLQLAPGGIVTHIHPLKGNEKALGHNLFLDDARRKEAFLAVKNNYMTLAGPFELIQGGVAVIGRNPVYLSLKSGEVTEEVTEQFWGFVSALIYLEDLLKATELDLLQDKYSYQLTRQHPDTGVSEVFARSDSPLTKNNYSVTVQVPNASWQLTMSRAEAALKGRLLTGYIISILAAIVAAWVTYSLLQQPEKLRRRVSEKTYELAYQANHDALTGLANRRCLSEQLARVLNESSRYNRPAVLLYMDLDNFKRVNDSMGHEAGDSLLQQIASRLAALFRDTDIVARLGGDEFAVLLLGDISIRDVGRIATKVIDTIEQPIKLGKKSFVVSTSIGITLIPADGKNDTTILNNADLAMYAAKRSGKRKFYFYDKSLQDAAIAKQILDDDLADAIKQQQFVLHYQPIMSLTTGELNGCEALIRWRHPQKGLLYPDEFIAALEESGKIIDVGYWVIQQVCQQIKRAELEGSSGHLFSVNLSPKQFIDPHLIENIRHTVRSLDINASLLELEITESCIMENMDTAIDMLKKLRDLGISIALDDFGTGYSSLTLLKRLPVDRLKIDRSFVSDLEMNLDDQKIVQGLIGMAHKLQLTVVAEGIENKTQQQLLQSYQCDFGQGYLFSKPIPNDQFKQTFTQGVNVLS